jgi:hypothetical protein
MITERPELAPFNVDAMLAEARRRSGGLEDVGAGGSGQQFLEGMSRLLDSLERDARLHEIGRLVARESVLMHTVNRLSYINDRKLYPEIAEEKIVRPVFIIGFPRTGTTILHDILAQDPETRAPLTWETRFPSPPPEAATFESDPRIAACQAEFPTPETETERDRQFRAMHPMGATLSQECVTMMGQSMCTPLFHNQFRVPTYEDWVDTGADWSHVYDFHQQQLQHLGWRAPKRDRWVLKTGAHMWGLEHLLTTYPDARIVFTHRDPVKSVTSFASLASHVHAGSSNEVDRVEVAHDWAGRLRRAIEHTMQVRESGTYPDAIFYDMYFPDFVADQFAAVTQIYEALDLPMTEQAARRMKAFIADNPKGKHGVHSYTPEEYGLDPQAIRRDLRPYIERFDLQPE